MLYQCIRHKRINTCDSDVQLSTPDMQPLPASLQQPSKCRKENIHPNLTMNGPDWQMWNIMSHCIHSILEQDGKIWQNPMWNDKGKRSIAARPKITQTIQLIQKRITWICLSFLEMSFPTCIWLFTQHAMGGSSCSEPCAYKISSCSCGGPFNS